jgi:hypothetical protein
MGMKKIGGSGHVESAWVWALQSCGGMWALKSAWKVRGKFVESSKGWAWKVRGKLRGYVGGVESAWKVRGKLEGVGVERSWKIGGCGREWA